MVGTKVDTYKKGKGKKRAVRKYWAVGRHVYIEEAWDHPEWGLKVGQEVCFQRKNIIEVPGWSASNEAMIEAAKLAKRPPPPVLLQK